MAMYGFAAGYSTNSDNSNSSINSVDSIYWTEDELAFMKAHPVICIGVDPDFVPFEFIDEDGEYKGIAAVYLALISEITGLHFEIVTGLTWSEVYDKALAGDIDVLPAIGKTSEREKHFLFSEPYYYFKRVIVTRDTDTGISGIDDLYGLTVAVQRNSSNHSYLLSYPKINLSLYDSAETALTAVATGEEKAFIDNLATTNYLIRSNGLTNLRFVSFEAEKKQSLHFAVRKDWPELVSIFNKAMNAITENEKLDINNKWIQLDTHIDYSPIVRILTIIGALITVALSVSFFWILRLQKEIKQRKHIQIDLEKAKYETDEANKYKSSFLARMSHEIRTPLNTIMGLSHLLKKTEMTLTQNIYIDRIIQAANSMLSVINDILDYSKIEAGKIELEVTSFSLDQVIQNVVNIVSYKINEQGIGFRLSKDPLVPNWFFGDPKRIEQILLNVLNNAVKFTAKGEVSFDIRLIAKENDTYHISFSIKDTGIGMTKEQVRKIFIPFEQGDSSITRRFGGSGLGLSIVKNLVDMMGGEVKVYSTLGEGSTFVINLALNIDKDKESLYAKALSSNHFKNIRTLILEKSGANINLIGSYLGSLGMDCELTSSETSAISMLEAAGGKFSMPFDLFIVDYDTPAKGGFNFIERIRNNNKIVKMPKIIMLFPMMRYDLFDKLNEYGIDMGIGKPIMPSILLNGILDIFNLKAISDSQILSHSYKEPATTKLEKKHWVLLAEDNKTNQLVVKSFLEQVGINTIIANDGKEAIELYREYIDDIDLILMDLHMPDMDGYEAAEKIRQFSDKVPIVAMTADVILGVREKCKQSGIYHYVSKPFNPGYFIQTIKNILNENEADKDESGINTEPSIDGKPDINMKHNIDDNIDTNPGIDIKHNIDAEPGIDTEIGPNTKTVVLDRQMGIKNMGGNEELYFQALEEYYKENKNTLEKIEMSIQEKRYSDAAKIVHKVKSSSGSIGAKSLQNIAMLFQKALEEEK